MKPSSQSRHPDASREPMPMVCSTCGKDFLLDETEAPPFCSQRCRMIDLGRWLDEEIGVPHEGGNGGQTTEHHREFDDEDDESESEK